MVARYCVLAGNGHVLQYCHISGIAIPIANRSSNRLAVLYEVPSTCLSSHSRHVLWHSCCSTGTRLCQKLIRRAANLSSTGNSVLFI